MKTSQAGIDFIKAHEGCKLIAYLDSVNIPTIGTGHTKGVYIGQTITQQQADEFLAQDLLTAETCINKQNLDLTQWEFDALASFVFNEGCGNFNSSHLLLYLKNDMFVKAAGEFSKWIFAGGKPLQGLVKRRHDEMNLFTHTTTT